MTRTMSSVCCPWSSSYIRNFCYISGMEEIKILVAPYDTVPDSIKVQGSVSDNPFDYVRIYADAR